MDQNAEEAKAELAAVLASRAFHGSPKLSSLLGYLFANGKPGSLTQAVIAVEFFGRNTSEYDPNADSMVRTEIRRLRLKLHRSLEAIPKIGLLEREIVRALIPCSLRQELDPRMEPHGRETAHPSDREPLRIGDAADAVFGEAKLAVRSEGDPIQAAVVGTLAKGPGR